MPSMAGLGALTHALTLAMGLGLGSSRVLPAHPEFIVVVNVSNPITEIEREALSKIFLKRSTRWPAGEAVSPVDLPMASSSRGDFSRRVLRKSMTAVRAYWQQQIFSGREVPPAEKSSEEAVLAAIRSEPGAIGYIAASSTLPTGVKSIVVLGIDD